MSEIPALTETMADQIVELKAENARLKAKIEEARDFIDNGDIHLEDSERGDSSISRLAAILGSETP